MRVFLVVKGAPAEAECALLARGIAWREIGRTSTHETHVRAECDAVQPIADWFNDAAYGSRAPYRPGALLWYVQTERPEEGIRT